MTKKLFFATLATVAVMTSCSQNDVYTEETSPVEDAINFASSVGQTRANAITTANLEEVSLYGYNVAGDFASRTALANFFEPNPETLKLKNNSWELSKVYKWSELNGGKLNTFSFHPTAGIVFEEPTLSSPAKFAYATPIPANQVDLLVASNLNMTKTTTSGNVNITYKHALSQLYFNVKLASNDYKIVIKNIDISGVKDKASFTYNSAKTAEDPTAAGTWGNLTGNVAFAYFATGQQATFSSTTATKVDGTNGNLMLLPQAKSPTFKFKVTYDIKDLADNKLQENVVQEANMEALAQGKKYAYTLVLPRIATEEITFSVTVDEWDESSVDSAREIRFDDFTLGAVSDAKDISDIITTYAGKTTTVYTHTFNVTGKELASAMEINLSTLPTKVIKDSKIILNFKIDDWKTQAISFVTPSGWNANVTTINANGQVVITKQ